MPMVSALLSDARVLEEPGSDEGDDPVPIRSEDLKLFLPSSLPLRLRIGPLYQSLASKETRLRIAQAEDALAEIRRMRRILLGVIQFRESTLR